MIKATQRASRRANQPPFPESSAWDRTGFLLWHATLEWSRKVNRALAETGLTQVQFSLLAGAAYLNHRGGAPSQAELADHAGMDVMMTSQVMRSLESDRLVKRLADKNDARVKRIVPTANGVDVVAAAIKLVELLDDEVFGLIEDIDRFKEALRLVADRDLDGQRTSGE